VLAERTRAGHPAADARSGHDPQTPSGDGFLQSENPAPRSGSAQRRHDTRGTVNL